MQLAYKRNVLHVKAAEVLFFTAVRDASLTQTSKTQLAPPQDVLEEWEPSQTPDRTGAWHQTPPGRLVHRTSRGRPRPRRRDLSIRMALVCPQTDVVSQEAARAACMKMPHIRLVRLRMAAALFPLLWVCVCWHLPDKISSSEATQARWKKSCC